MSDSEPHESGRLDVGDGQSLYWECRGNPHGAAAVVLHGGPGSGCGPRYRDWFDLDAYRIVLFDQRNCGRSTPHAAQPRIDLSANTTAHLITDIEQLRIRLGVQRWLVAGVSWGTTLALAAAAWCAWEDTHVSTVPGHKPDPRYADATFRLCFARLVTHYWKNAAFLEPGQLLDGVELLADIPAVLVQGRLDISAPPDVAWQLHKRWPRSELVLLDGVGHGATREAMRAATDQLVSAGRW